MNGVIYNIFYVFNIVMFLLRRFGDWIINIVMVNKDLFYFKIGILVYIILFFEENIGFNYLFRVFCFKDLNIDLNFI